MASAERHVPKDIKFDAIVVDVSFHPNRDVIAAGDLDGDVSVYSYSLTEKNHLLMTLEHHKQACRALQFNGDGSRLFTVSKDKSLQALDMERGAVISAITDAHDEAIYCLGVADDNIVATGDDDGRLKVWDLRQDKAVMDVRENDDFLSDMMIADNKRLLLATSGDGTLSAFDIRKHKMKLQSELFDSEFLSLAAVKRGGKVVCGTGEGVLNIFNWGEWGNISDRFPGHKGSIDCMIPITDDILCTGSMDGVVRAVHILPNRFIGVIGEHEEFPVENMSRSRCGRYIASCSHDQKIKFWDISKVEKEVVDASRKAKKTNKPKHLGSEDFFAGFQDEEKKDDEVDDSSSDDDSDDDIVSDDDSDVATDDDGSDNDNKVDTTSNSRHDQAEEATS